MNFITLSFMFVTLILLSSAAQTEANSPVSSIQRRHHAKAVRKRSLEVVEADVLEKRSYNGIATWYSIKKGNVGACGHDLNAADYVVALNEEQYGGLDSQSSHCGKTITITNGVKTTKARIEDACPKGVQCHWGALDMSQNLFKFFNPLGVGVFHITWWFGDGGDTSTKNKEVIESYNGKKGKSDKEAAKKEAAKNNERAAKHRQKQQRQAIEMQRKQKHEHEHKHRMQKLRKQKAKGRMMGAEKSKEVKKEEEGREGEHANKTSLGALHHNLASLSQILKTLHDIVNDLSDTK